MTWSARKWSWRSCICQRTQRRSRKRSTWESSAERRDKRRKHWVCLRHKGQSGRWLLRRTRWDRGFGEWSWTLCFRWASRRWALRRVPEWWGQLRCPEVPRFSPSFPHRRLLPKQVSPRWEGQSGWGDCTYRRCASSWSSPPNNRPWTSSDDRRSSRHNEDWQCSRPECVAALPSPAVKGANAEFGHYARWRRRWLVSLSRAVSFGWSCAVACWESN